MNITVIGASGKTGREVVAQALDAGHKVTALVRRAEALQPQAGLTIVVGDVTNPNDIGKVLKGADAAISALGSMGADLMTAAIKAVTAASKNTGLQRFILLSASAVKRDQLAPSLRVISGIVLKKAIRDKTASEALLRASELNWTIVHATALTKKPKSEKLARVVAGQEKIGMKHKIARADVAAWMLHEVEAAQYPHKDVVITGA